MLSTYNKKGEEIPDPKPVAVPVKFTRPMPLKDRIKMLLRSEEFRRAMDNQGMETFDEADDFDMDEDHPDPSTPYEEVFDEGMHVAAREQEIRAGVVEDRTLEQKERAREIVAKARQSHRTASGAGDADKRNGDVKKEDGDAGDRVSGESK